MKTTTKEIKKQKIEYEVQNVYVCEVCDLEDPNYHNMQYHEFQCRQKVCKHSKTKVLQSDDFCFTIMNFCDKCHWQEDIIGVCDDSTLAKRQDFLEDLVQFLEKYQ